MSKPSSPATDPAIASRTALVLARLADYVIDGDASALDLACDAAVSDEVTIAELIEGLESLGGQRGDPQRLQLARVRLRAALQLPLRPGPVCRPG